MISKQKAVLVKFELLKFINKINAFCIIFFITRRVIFLIPMIFIQLIISMKTVLTNDM